MISDSGRRLDCKLVRRDGTSEEFVINTDYGVPQVGDSLTVNGRGEFYISELTHQLTLHGNKVFAIVQYLRHCPECGLPHGNVHPDTGCGTGTVQAVMES